MFKFLGIIFCFQKSAAKAMMIATLIMDYVVTIGVFVQQAMTIAPVEPVQAQVRYFQSN